MISIQQLLPETHISANYSDTVAAAVAPSPGRAMYIPLIPGTCSPWQMRPRANWWGVQGTTPSVAMMD